MAQGMAQPIQINLPHTLGKFEATRRMRTRIGELPAHIPGGLASVEHRWTADDRLALDIAALGAKVSAMAEVDEANIRLSVQLPPLLEPFRAKIETAIRNRATTLLLPDAAT